MAAITKRTYQLTDDRCLILEDEEWVRKLPFGNDWQKIRLGVLLALPTQGALTVDGLLTIGICSGNTAPASASWTQNFIGIAIGNPVGPIARAWTYTAAVPNPYLTGPIAYAYRRYWQTQATVAGGQPVIAPANVGAFKRRSPIFIDLARSMGGSGLCTISAWAPNTTTVLVDYRPDHLLDGVDQQALPTVNGQAMTSLFTTTLPLSDMFGPLDSFCIYWSKASLPIEIYAICASVINDLSWPPGSGGVYDSLGTDTPFSVYTAGSITTGGTLSGGIGWAGPYAFYGTGNATPVVGFYGTSVGPYDSFEQYGTGTVLSGATLLSGTGFTGPGLIYGNGIPAPMSGFFAGTSYGDYDSFESYPVGAVTTGVTINAGSNWGGPGRIY